MKVDEAKLLDFFNINKDNEKSLLKINFVLYAIFTIIFVDLTSIFNKQFFSDNVFAYIFPVLFNIAIPIFAIWCISLNRKITEAYVKCMLYQGVLELFTALLFVYLATITFYREKIKITILHIIVILVSAILILGLLLYRHRILKYGKKDTAVKPMFYTGMIPIALIVGYIFKRYTSNLENDSKTTLISFALIFMVLIYILISIIYFDKYFVAKKYNCNQICIDYLKD